MRVTERLGACVLNINAETLEEIGVIIVAEMIKRKKSLVELSIDYSRNS